MDEGFRFRRTLWGLKGLKVLGCRGFGVDWGLDSGFGLGMQDVGFRDYGGFGFGFRRSP